MDLWTDEERRMARKLGVPVASNRSWWWRARHVLNSQERQQLAGFTDWLGRRYAPERRRLAMHAV